MPNKFLTFLAARWKALMPLVVYVASEVLNRGFDLSTPVGLKAAIPAVISAVLVYVARNGALPGVLAPKPKDAGLGLVEVLVVIIALGLVLIAIKVY